MSTVTDNDLKELKDLISDLAKTQKEEFNQLNEKVNDIRVEMAGVKENLASLNKRVDSMDIRLNTLITVTFTALLGIIGKIVFFK